MSKIQHIWAREILDSRGNPTVETQVVLDNQIQAKASVPSGASTGSHEAWELRDQDETRYNGKGVLQAVENVKQKIAPKLKGIEVENQREIDDTMIELDDSFNKRKLGGNAILSVSLACARAAAQDKGQELYVYLRETYELDFKEYTLPTPSFNIFNGGKHADTNLDFQELMILPLKNLSFKEKVRMGSEVFHSLGEVLKESGLRVNIGNEGGYAPEIDSSIQAIEFIVAAIHRAGYEPGIDTGIGTDVGSSELFDKDSKKYIFPLDDSYFVNSTLTDLYKDWFRKYPIVSIEDGLAQDEWQAWRELTQELGEEVMLIGDDLFVTSTERLRKGLKEQAANAILIKPNQVGTLSETMDCIKLAHKHNYTIMASHRSGETCDTFISDLAVAAGAQYIKAGSASRGERVAKYNRLMEIEEQVSSHNK